VLYPYSKPIEFSAESSSEERLQILLFVDDRSNSQDNIKQIQNYLQNLQAEYSFDLQIIEIAQQPHLVEHYKLIATPALVKISPLPKQTLAGSNLTEQLQKWWHRWQPELEEFDEETEVSVEAVKNNNSSFNYSDELIKLTDELFKLKKEKEECLEQLKFKDRILAMLAHDLRSPLTAASIALETLESLPDKVEGEKLEKLRKHLHQQARKQFQLMNKMITDLLQASKNMSSQLKLQPQELYLQFLCQEVLHQLEDRMQKKSLKLIEDLPQDLPPVYGDEELLRQTLLNLLDNAIKYTPERGEIKMSILHRTSQKIQVSICDTGPGIPLEKQERIFEGHFRLKRDEAKEGYGLGLSLCRQVIQAHYGQIWVDSDREKGSCFHFTLPVYR
jgi:two-component system clock-associated histidine kinase SasA